MKLVLEVLAVASLLEILLWTPLLWRFRKPIAGILVIVLSVTSGVLIGLSPRIWTAIFLIVSIYRVINLLRIMQNRTRQDILLPVARKTSLWLIASQLCLVGSAWLQSYYSPSIQFWLYALAMLQFGVALILIASSLRHLKTTRAPEVSEFIADRDLPTLTVAIPARNETEDLELCLQSLITCNYPKLEIIVLDDCSQERRTPEIIRGFAHDGVTFVAGKAPNDSWLAKNYAYQQLVEASSGDVLLFCGVDTRFTESSLRTLVATLLKKNKSMLSVIPSNMIPYGWHLGLQTIQSSRYAWELVLPRRLFQRPPILSTCWLIQRKTLKETGGFEAVKHSISPESFFARQIARSSDGYTFLQSNLAIGVSSAKTLDEQHATAVRTRYPQLHKRPELVALFSLLELTVLVLPLLLIGLAFVNNYSVLLLIAVITYALLIWMYALIMQLTYRRFLLKSIWLLPAAAIYDIVLANYSMWQYEFNSVIWKDRNVCVPVMRTIPSLPKLS